MTPADRLHAAADLLEKLAGEATPGPWTPHYASDLHTDSAAWIGAPGQATPDGVFVATTASALEGLGDATYIATMHPEVGKLIASSLRDAACAIENNVNVRIPRGLPPIQVASACLLDLADLLLAGTS